MGWDAERRGEGRGGVSESKSTGLPPKLRLLFLQPLGLGTRCGDLCCRLPQLNQLLLNGPPAQRIAQSYTRGHMHIAYIVQCTHCVLAISVPTAYFPSLCSVRITTRGHENLHRAMYARRTYDNLHRAICPRHGG